ncbi:MULTISPECIES: phosphotransferase family protein [Streptomyces]|nr:MULTISPECIES: aminoglycoside phosphotransferase family protein [Streptomyces]
MTGMTGSTGEQHVPVDPRLAAAIGPEAVVKATVMPGGFYNDTRLLELTDGRRLAWKRAPAMDAPALTHERGLLGTERLFNGLAAAAGVRVPKVVHHHTPAHHGAAREGEWLLLEFLEGTTWDSERDRIDPARRSALRRRLGETAARIATATGPEFGYPQTTDPVLRGPDWPTAFGRMLAAVLADAVRYGVPLPVPEPELAALPDRFATELAEVRRPALVHFDAWEGNVILAPAAHGHLDLVGVIDGERSFFGDPLAELVGLDPLGTAEHDADLLAGYRSVTPDLPLHAAAQARLALYRVYLALIMRIEAVPRRYDPDRTHWLTTWSATRITEQLALLERLSTGRA